MECLEKATAQQWAGSQTFLFAPCSLPLLQLLRKSWTPQKGMGTFLILRTPPNLPPHHHHAHKHIQSPLEKSLALSPFRLRSNAAGHAWKDGGEEHAEDYGACCSQRWLQRALCGQRSRCVWGTDRSYFFLDTSLHFTLLRVSFASSLDSRGQFALPYKLHRTTPH